MEPLELIPCKIHGTLPQLRRVEIAPTANSLIRFQDQERSEFYCVKCDLEKKMSVRNEMVKNWNYKQENK